MPRLALTAFYSARPVVMAIWEYLASRSTAAPDVALGGWIEFAGPPMVFTKELIVGLFRLACGSRTGSRRR